MPDDDSTRHLWHVKKDGTFTMFASQISRCELEAVLAMLGKVTAAMWTKNFQHTVEATQTRHAHCAEVRTVRIAAQKDETRMLVAA